MFTVKKIHSGQYRHKDGKWTYNFPPGWAVLNNGLPIAWKNRKGAVNVEVYGRKYIAQHVADNYNEKGFEHSEALLPSFPTVMIHTNDRAYPFEYDKEWRVWRPDRCPHHFGHYTTEIAAQRSADRINAALGVGKEQ